MKLMKVCWLGSRYIISPMARISRNMIRPTPMYTKMMLGPVSAIDLPEPRNSPVPMVPPMAMNCTWRLLRPRAISLPLSSDSPGSAVAGVAAWAARMSAGEVSDCIPPWPAEFGFS